MSTSPSDSKENEGVEREKGFRDKLSTINAEIDQVMNEIDSSILSESFAQSTNEFEAIQERWKHLKVAKLSLAEMDKELVLLRASVVKSSEILEAKLERLRNLFLVREDTKQRIELEKLLIRCIAQGKQLEQLGSQHRNRISNVNSRGGDISLIEKPSVTWMLLWPCMWSITLAAPPGHLPDFEMLALFGLGALLLRVAEGSVNDFFYRDIDTKVGQTKLGAVATGKWSFDTILRTLFTWISMALGHGIFLRLNNYCRVLGVSSLLLIFSYPLMKRFTFWPQAYRGLIFNWGALLGWAAVKGNLDPSIVLPLFVSGVFWTLLNDAIYAHQDKSGKVKSTALHFGDSTKEWTTGFGIASIGCLALGGFNAELGFLYYAFLAVASGHLGWQIWSVDLSSPADCNNKLASNKWFGAIIFAGILAGRLSS